MKKETIEKILQETETGYDQICEKFSQTRKHFWRELEFVADYARPNDTVLDFGCGNGRLLELIGKGENLEYYGIDVSQGLVDIAKKHYGEQKIHFSKIDPSQKTIPFEENFFNSVYSIAVFHHFPSKQYRVDIAKELYRVTKKNGYVIVTVWNLWQKKYFKNIFENWLAKLVGKGLFDWNDCEISFTDNQGKKFQRFHHAFTKRELEKLFEQAGFETQMCGIFDKRNIIYIGKQL